MEHLAGGSGSQAEGQVVPERNQDKNFGRNMNAEKVCYYYKKNGHIRDDCYSLKKEE